MHRYVVLTLFAAVVLVGCSDNDASQQATLGVETQNWTGWSEEQPEPEVTSVTIGEDSTFELRTTSGTVTFTVTGVDDDHVEVDTDEALVLDDGDGIDLEGGETSFTVRRGDPLKVTTPTMDGGTTITLTLG